MGKNSPYPFNWEGLADQSTGHPVIYELQINSGHLFSISISHTILGTHLYQNVFIIYLQFQFNWMFYILSGNPSLTSLLASLLLRLHDLLKKMKEPRVGLLVFALTSWEVLGKSLVLPKLHFPCLSMKLSMCIIDVVKRIASE